MEDGKRAVLTSASLWMRLSGLWAHLGLTRGPGQLPPEAGAHRGEEGKKKRMKGREGGKEGGAGKSWPPSSHFSTEVVFPT